jgi:hypothetical protein
VGVALHGHNTPARHALIPFAAKKIHLWKKLMFLL